MTTIKLKNGSGAPAGGDLTQGEPALDLTNKRLYTEDSGGNVIEVGTNPGTDVTFADNRKALFGTGSDLQIFHDGNHSYLKDAGTGDLYIQGEANVRITDGDGNKMFLGQNDGEVQLYYNGAEKLNTTATGIDVTGNASFGDNGKAIFGAGSDLQIYHDGTNSYIVNTTNDLIIGEDTRVRIKTPSLLVNNAADNENLLTATENGAVTLYYDNAAKIATTSTGIDVTGTVTADGATIDNGHIKLSAGYSLQWDDTHERIEQSNGNLEFFTNNSQQMTISGGNVGIGTTSPDRQLSVNDFSGNGTVSINASTTGASTLYFADGNTGTNVYTGFIQYNHSDNAMQFATNGGNERMRIDSSGNVGIGTTSPDEDLHVHASSGDGVIKITGDGSETNGGKIKGFNGGLAIDVTNGSGSYAERMRIDSSGNLLVSKSSLDVGEVGLELRNDGLLAATRSGSNVGVFRRLSDDGSIVDFQKDSTTVGSIGCNNNDPYIARAGGNGFRWYSGAVVPTNDSGATADNAMDLGSSVGRYKDLYLSGTARASTYRLQSGSTTTGGLFHEKDITGSGSSVDTSVYAETGNAIHFMVNGSATPVGTFDTSGNFGIGTSNPANNGLHIEKSGTARLRLAQAGVRSWDMEATGGAWRLNNATNSSEAFRVDSSGNLLVGTTASRTGNYSISLEPSNSLMYFRAAGTGSIQQAIFVRDTTGTPVSVGSIATTGTATAYNTSSDQRLKENIVDAPSASDEIDAIQVRSFDWKADGSHQKYGMIAQELQDVAPEAVSEGKTEEDMMGVDYSKLVPMLVKEIQSLRARVAQLEGAN